MRHAAGLVLALAACNQVLGVSATRRIDAAPLIDAQLFDSPADAPFTCPGPGGTPQFKQVYHQVVSGCANYTESENHQRAISLCQGTNLYESDQGQAFQPIAELASVTAIDPRLAPEGDELFVVVQAAPSSFSIEAYHRDTTGHWQHDFTVMTGVTLGNDVHIGAVTRGPTRRMMLSNYTALYTLYEIELDATSAHVVHQYTMAEIGTYVDYAPYLSPDGLRLYYSPTSQSMLYWDRPDLGSLFGSPRPVPTAPQVGESFITADCAQLYAYSVDLRTLFWVQQL